MTLARSRKVDSRCTPTCVVPYICLCVAYICSAASSCIDILLWFTCIAGVVLICLCMIICIDHWFKNLLAWFFEAPLPRLLRRLARRSRDGGRSLPGEWSLLHHRCAISLSHNRHLWNPSSEINKIISKNGKAGLPVALIRFQYFFFNIGDFLQSSSDQFNSKAATKNLFLISTLLCSSIEVSKLTHT